ncbi:MAG: hypothetical protein AB1427_14915 [Thermodesulfobacteriota bacterium]
MTPELKTFLINIVSGVILAALLAVWSKSRSYISRRLPALSLIIFFIILFGLTVIFAVSIITLAKPENNKIVISFIVIIFDALLFTLLLIEFGNAQFVGINHIDKRVSEGLSYNKALTKCRNRIRFLGLGASKLTSDPEFEQALLRCTHEGPIKFILLKPSDSLLVEAAKRAKKDHEEYTKIVRSSLRKLRDLKINRMINLEVRFYNELPIFRLMFIDDSVCLVSYYVLGEGDGSQLPQIHFVRNPVGKRTIESFYYAFDNHFNRIWKYSEPWDFKKYLEENL